MPKNQLRSGAHVVFSINLHIVFVTKYRRKVLTVAMLESIEKSMNIVLVANQCKIIEFGGEPDHVHLLLDVHPDNNISVLVGSLKSVSSRMIGKDFPDEIKKTYRDRKGLWHDSKCIVSCGGAALEIVKKYVSEQSGGRPDCV